MKKLVLFGAGKIGRSFIGQLFSAAGYEVVFVDVFEPVVKALNEKNRYKVVVKSNQADQIIWVENVRAVNGKDTQSVMNEIVDADIMAVSVGQAGLNAVLPVVAKGLLKRFDEKGKNPLDLIIAENLRDASSFIAETLQKNLPQDFPLSEMLGLVESSIGKMVPIMRQQDMEEDMLQVFAEPYNTLILDAKGFLNPIPEISNLEAKENMKAWVDRKLFIHNLGHATTAYLGFVNNPALTLLYQVLENPKIEQQVYATMKQAGETLLSMYPDEFSEEHIEAHINDLIHRFKNKALGDTVFRVGCDLHRKLSREDRLVAALTNARENRLPCDQILYALVAGCFFRAKDEQGNMHPGDIDFAELLEKEGLESVMNQVCGLDTPSFKEIIVEAYQISYELESLLSKK